MKGLELNRDFFFEWGLPFIEKEVPELKDHVAAGCFGGSQALGADDHVSQDHGWGPRFELILDDDYEAPLADVVERLCVAAPDEFKGYGHRGDRDAAVRGWGCTEFFKNIFGCVPNTDCDWVYRRSNLEIVESGLYFLRHGTLFFDGHGRFSELRERYSQYPDDVMLLRMRQSSWRIAHYGEYNFCGRLVERGDRIPMQVALGYFTEAMMRMYFYLDGDFAPYWKWLGFEFRKRQFSPTTAKALETLHRLGPTEQADQIHSICMELKQKTIDCGLVSDLENPNEIPWFSLLARHLKQRISDERIRNL